MLEQKGICQGHALLYEAYVLFLVAKGNLLEAEKVYQLGISRFVDAVNYFSFPFSSASVVIFVAI